MKAHEFLDELNAMRPLELLRRFGLFGKSPDEITEEPWAKECEVSFAEYLQTVQKAQAANATKILAEEVLGLRRGQIHFNVLCDLHPTLAESVRGSDLDPFYRDDLVPAFLEHIQKAWSPESEF